MENQTNNVKRQARLQETRSDVSEAHGYVNRWTKPKTPAEISGLHLQKNKTKSTFNVVQPQTLLTRLEGLHKRGMEISK